MHKNGGRTSNLVPKSDTRCLFFLQFYSCRKATIGSIREARCAGATAATTAAPARIATAPISAAGSRGFTPKSSDSAYFDASKAAVTPTTMPPSPSRTTSDSTSHSTLARSAPSAIRIPISLVRRATL